MLQILIVEDDELFRLGLKMRLPEAGLEIAKSLGIAHGTVRVHVHAILHKLEVRDRTQAAVVALQKQLTHNINSRDLEQE